MQLIISGDLHLQKKLMEEGKAFLTTLIEKIKGCDGIVLLGDTYNKEYPHPDIIELFLWFLQQIPPNKSVYVIGGNHEIKKDVNATKWLPLVRPNIIYHPEKIETYIEGKKVVMLHTDVAESNVGPKGIHISKKSYRSIDADIILLGHVHKPQIIAEKPLTLHPGSPYYIHFGERTDEEKGYYILDFEHEVTYEWKSFKCIPMYQFEIDSTNIKTIQSKIEKVEDKSKVKLVFTLEGYSLEMLRRANEIVQKNNKRFVEFVYTFNYVYKEIEMDEVNKEKDKTIPQLLEDFCKLEEVDESIRKILLGLTNE